jgi:hypothetical protein
MVAAKLTKNVPLLHPSFDQQLWEPSQRFPRYRSVLSAPANSHASDQPLSCSFAYIVEEFQKSLDFSFQRTTSNCCAPRFKTSISGSSTITSGFYSLRTASFFIGVFLSLLRLKEYATSFKFSKHNFWQKLERQKQ